MGLGGALPHRDSVFRAILEDRDVWVSPLFILFSLFPHLLPSPLCGKRALLTARSAVHGRSARSS